LFQYAVCISSTLFNFDVSANPESFAKEEALDSKDLKNKLPALVKFSQWKKIKVIEKEKICHSRVFCFFLSRYTFWISALLFPMT
jgi:hypothetical protein